MQLHLDTVELNMLADVLLEIKHPAPVDEGLLDKVLTKDLRLDSDELQQLGDLLAKRAHQLKDENACAQDKDAAARFVLEQKLRLLERILERVNEACVMF
jgi:uncharacterized protein (DUF342 family)